MTSKNNNEAEFYVVQFIDLPYEDIDNYVCVPYTWMIARGHIDQMTVVAYPIENPIDTRDRVKRKEEYNDAWNFYVATMKFISNSYDDAELWIARKKDPSSLVKEKSKVTDSSDTYDNRPSTSQTINNDMRITSIGQNLTNLSNLAQQKQMQPKQLNSQQRSQKTNRIIGICNKLKNRKPITFPRKVTKKKPAPTLTKLLNSLRQTLSTTQIHLLSNKPQLQSTMSAQSTGDINVDLTTSPQNIIKTSDRKSTEMSSRPIYQPSRTQHTTAHENRCQNLCIQEHLVNQSTRTKTKRVHFVNDTAKSLNESHINVMNNVCQTDECLVKETFSRNHTVTSGSTGTITDHNEISNNNISTDESIVVTTNNAFSTANNPGHGSADRPTAAQNSMSTNAQTHPKIILEQQMLDNIVTFLTQMGSFLSHANDMHENLRSSILDIAKIYKKVLGGVKPLNTAKKATPSSNSRPESPRYPEKRHTKVAASACSSNLNQHIKKSYKGQQSKGVAKKNTKRNHKFYRFVLPSEYDAYDTRWTLKYRTILPGLVELTPQSGVYVNQEDFKHCQELSKDCKSLALRLLEEVFKRNALSVCASMSEKVQTSKSVDSDMRPDLDDHACSVLINFVLQYGLQRGWNTDLQPILRTLHCKVLEIRFRYGVMVEC